MQVADTLPDPAGLDSFFADLSQPLLHIEAKPVGHDWNSLAEAAEAWLDAEQAELLRKTICQLPVEDPQRLSESVVSSALAEIDIPEQRRRLIEHASHVRRCDRLLASLIEQFEPRWRPGDLLIVTAQAGDPRAIRSPEPDWLTSLAEPVVHVPLLVHLVGEKQRDRFAGLLSFADLAARLTQFAAVPSDLSAPSFPQVLMSSERTVLRYESPLACALRAPEWLLVEDRSAPAAGDEPAICLFRLPEDPWLVRNVAGQHPELIERYQATGEL
jgi:hypothetical protein